MNGGGSDKVCNLYAYAALCCARTLMTVRAIMTRQPTLTRVGRVGDRRSGERCDVVVVHVSGQRIRADDGYSGMLVTSILANIVFFVTDVWALVYYFQAIVVVAFAPFFPLAGDFTKRGTRKYFFGWLQQILSSVLKFLVSEVILLVSLSSCTVGVADAFQPGDGDTHVVSRGGSSGLVP